MGVIWWAWLNSKMLAEDAEKGVQTVELLVKASIAIPALRKKVEHAM